MQLRDYFLTGVKFVILAKSYGKLHEIINWMLLIKLETTSMRRKESNFYDLISIGNSQTNTNFLTQH